MNKNELKNKLDVLGVAPHAYSLEGKLVPDNIVLNNSYHIWEVFYFDERGGKNNQQVFDTESDACEHIYKLFKESKAIEDKYLK